MRDKKMERLCSELAKYRVECQCGHRISIPPTNKKDFVICSWCGRKIYKNKQCEFKDKMKSILK